MRKYEIMYIVKSTVDEENRKALIEQLAKIVTDNGGSVVKTEEWGLREFAYEIDKMNKGYYVIITIEANNTAVSEFDRLVGINANIVRHMIVKLEG